jgi:uncharacterized protein with HEPN domain
MSNYSAPRFIFYLREMHAAIERILAYSKESKNFEAFEADRLRLDAIIRNFEVIGEAVKHVPFRFQRQHSSIPWREMLELRNFIVHEFFDVDIEILWEIIQTHLQDNANDLARLIARGDY